MILYLRSTSRLLPHKSTSLDQALCCTVERFFIYLFVYCLFLYFISFLSPFVYMTVLYGIFALPFVCLDFRIKAPDVCYVEQRINRTEFVPQFIASKIQVSLAFYCVSLVVYTLGSSAFV